ncbi:hypothetical protein BDQ12DRAFT_675776 [Crucibulum laeve]|uniref:Putative lipoate-protein ligase A n=1 Tax=Crucibulum laeve TaxID=68775 RepID=A0A5C3MG70_9AGAR|nr:hypothetical protein BDQ12DRAFT_675776 [Crucibulum laeve]
MNMLSTRLAGRAASIHPELKAPAFSQAYLRRRTFASLSLAFSAPQGRRTYYLGRIYARGLSSSSTTTTPPSLSLSSSSVENKDPKNPNHSIYISTSTDPYFNLTYEDWLFRNHPASQPLLFIYRDAPCVVIGRNQNPWKEVNFAALHARPEVKYVRRRSGGGTVYHDLGNTNFSIHLPRSSFDRHVTAQVALRAVCALGIEARVNDRNDICVGPNKVSGSAYKIVNTRAYHHGTMLIATQLETLGDLLRTEKETMITKGVASVRSPVCNLQQFSTSLTHEAFADAVVTEFCKEYGIDETVCTVHDTADVRRIEYIRKGIEELLSWEWAYGQTPEFTYTIGQSFAWGDITADIRSKHGIILECKLQLTNTRINGDASGAVIALARSFEGQRYGFPQDDAYALSDVGPAVDVRTWLQAAMS